MKRITIMAIVLGICMFVGLLVSAGRAQPTKDPSPDTEKVTALKKERLAVLRDALKLAVESHRNAVGPFTSIPRLTMNVLNSELDLAPDRAARVAVRERIVVQLKDIEKMVAVQHDAALTDLTDLLEAKAARLQGEFELLRETTQGE